MKSVLCPLYADRVGGIDRSEDETRVAFDPETVDTFVDPG